MPDANPRPRHLLARMDSDHWEPPPWHEQALCRTHLEVDFLTRHQAEQARAFQVCGRCPVRVECLEYALADPFLTGVWGGTDGAARRAIRRNRKAADASP